MCKHVRDDSDLATSSWTSNTQSQTTLITDADSSRISTGIAISHPRCDSVFLSACLCVILSVRTIKPKRLKLKSPNLATRRPSINIMSKCQRSRYSRSQCQKVYNVATRQPCGTVSLRLCRRANSSSHWRRSSGRRQSCTPSSAHPL